MPIYVEKICNMCTLLKYAKNAAISEIAYLHKTDMPGKDKAKTRMYYGTVYCCPIGTLRLGGTVATF